MIRYNAREVTIVWSRVGQAENGSQHIGSVLKALGITLPKEA